MEKSKGKIKVNNGLTMVKIGNYTRSAIESFEENIVNQENYLEKVDAGLNDKSKTENN
jgi:hypothetical protein